MRMKRFHIEYFSELDSTNSHALKLLAQGAPEGKVIVTDFQTNGRGKPGRTWFSPAGKNLLFSVLIRPPIRPHQAPMITQIVCRSVAKALQTLYGISSSFKRPNDVMVDGKKICGVLVEAQSRSNGHLEGVVIGIGLNINADSAELLPEATSIKMEKQRIYSRRRILQGILRQLRKDMKGLYGKA